MTLPATANSAATAEQLRATISAQLPSIDSPNKESWWLLGTTGCHLCDVAEQLLNDFQKVYLIDYIKVDIADFDEELIMQFATQIPVILTKNSRLDFPFSVLDLQWLL